MVLPFPPEKEYFSIGEAGRLTGTKPYILRYWESKFGLVRPARRESGQRKFTRQDVETIARIKELLYEKRFTIEGAKKYLRDLARRGPVQMSLELNETSAAVDTLRDVKKDITGLLKELKKRSFSSAGSS
ncbi:MAG TPA: MerR family transcriptional regulator [Elusimicrobiota bacterium]|nr:MerR family transcriptional regulator [Elusimicrobiota bacterium]